MEEVTRDKYGYVTRKSALQRGTHYTIPMRELLYSVDGPGSRSLSRMRLVVDKDALRSYISGLPQVTLWFQTDYFEDEHVDREVYGEAILQWCGGPNTSYTFCSGYPEPDGIISVPSALIDGYILSRMHAIAMFDVVLFCTTSKSYEVPQSRTIVHNTSKLSKQGDQKWCMFGRYATVDERTEVIEKCAEKDLSCVVVRAMRMDGEERGKEEYKWESEHRVTCVYL